MQRAERVEPRHAAGRDRLGSPSSTKLSERIRASGQKHQPHTNSAVPVADRDLAREARTRAARGGSARPRGRSVERASRSATVAGDERLSRTQRPPTAIRRDEFWRAIRARHPGCARRCAADARVTAMHRGERHEFRSRLDARGADPAAGVGQRRVPRAGPVPRQGAAAGARGPGAPAARPPAGDDASRRSRSAIRSSSARRLHRPRADRDRRARRDPPGAVISPLVTIGLRAGDVQGPTIERDVSIGTGRR